MKFNLKKILKKNGLFSVYFLLIIIILIISYILRYFHIRNWSIQWFTFYIFYVAILCLFIIVLNIKTKNKIILNISQIILNFAKHIFLIIFGFYIALYFNEFSLSGGLEIAQKAFLDATFKFILIAFTLYLLVELTKKIIKE